jgi:hypothetical protein
MLDFMFVPMMLDRFEGDGSAAAAGTEGGTESASPTRTQKGETILYGKQPVQEEKEEAVAAPVDKEALKKEFQELVRGKYKDEYTKATQDIINKRFKESKQLEEANKEYRSVIDVLNQKYNTSDTKALLEAINNDTGMWEDAADEAGMTVEQYRKFKQLERENAELMREANERQTKEKVDKQMAEWYQESEALKEKFPEFDLQNETQNPHFLAMLKSGVPMEHAFKVIHMDEIVTNAMKTTQALSEKRVVDNIRARGSRPVENGAGSHSAFTVKNDVTKLTRADRAAIAERVQRGERISF